MEQVLPSLGLRRAQQEIRDGNFENITPLERATRATQFAHIGHSHNFNRLRGQRIISWDCQEHPTMALLGGDPTALATTGTGMSGLGRSQASYTAIVDRLLGITEDAEWAC
jgi:hypothetical protein